MKDVELHLAGKVCLVLKADLVDDTCRWAMIDHDAYLDDQAKVKILSGASKQGLFVYSSKSGGLHTVVFFAAPIPCETARRFMRKLAADLGDPNAEIFPKPFGEGRLPFGIAMPFFGEPERFKAFKPKLHDVPTNGDVPEYLVTNAPDGFENVAPGDLLVHGIKLPDGIDFEAELKRHGLQFRKREDNGGISYDYHNHNGQPCLLAGVVHENNKDNIRCSRFFLKDGTVVHNCFDDDGLPPEEKGRTRKALAALGINFDSAPAVNPEKWRELFHPSADFLTVPPLSFSIEGFLQNDGSTMVGGLSGHMKTFIMLSIGKALLKGKGTRLWDLFPVLETAERILYLIPECSLSPFVHRLKLMNLLEFTQNDRLLVRTLNMGPPPLLQDPRLLCAAKGAHVFLDTAMRFADGDESSASDISQGLAKDLFALTGAGARAITGAHHSPKTFARENQMTLENVLRGSGDLGAMLSTCWAVKLVDPIQNIVHVENVKPRDFQPCGPFQLIARPFIDQTGDFRLFKGPGECGRLDEEQEPVNEKNQSKHRERAERLGMVKAWLETDPNLSAPEIVKKFAATGVSVNEVTVRKYRIDARKPL